MSRHVCWCGNTHLDSFSDEYLHCSACETLVSSVGLSADQALVKDDEEDFYGKNYWLSHQGVDLGLPTLSVRMRDDLTERCLYWLRDLLNYKLPPSKILELGSSHGGFVALLRQAGYEATGLELSPFIVSVARHEFGVPMLLGPVEQQQIALGSLDVIALMDVLEHLPDPEGTMRHCLSLLKPDGILLIQTPSYKIGVSFQRMMETQDSFLKMMQGNEHLYLFSERSVKDLFRRIGAEYVQFEPAIFSHYDMFLAVSRSPLQVTSIEQRELALKGTPNGRLALAMLDLRERELDLIRKLSELELDRAARGEQVTTLTEMIKVSEADGVARGEQIATLTEMIKASEADRVARGEQITTLTEIVRASEERLAEQSKRIVNLANLFRMFKK